MTPDEQQAAHARLTEIALGTLNWAEGQQKVHGYMCAGWRIRAAGEVAQDLLGLTVAYGPEQIFGDTPEAEKWRGLANSLSANIASLKDSRR